MAESDAALREESENGRAAEWERLDAEDGGQHDAPAADADRIDPPEPSDTGQASSPPAGPAAETPAGSDTSTTVDIWKDAPAHLREAFEAERGLRTKAENQVSTQSGRAASESRRRIELEAENRSLREKAPKDEAEPAPAMTDEARTQLREEYPDVAAPLLDVIGGLEKKVADLQAAGATQQQQREATDALETQRFLAEQEQSLAEQHPDWKTQTARAEFATWAQAQPRMIREALVRNGDGIVDAVEAGDIIARFKAAHGGEAPAAKVTQRREAQMRGGTLPKGPSPSSTPSTTTDRESEWARLDAQDAQRERQLSGGRNGR